MSAVERPVRVMRVIARLNMGGPALHVSYLAAGLKERGYETTLVSGTLARGESSMAFVADRLGVRVLPLAELGREISPLRDVVAAWKLARLLREERPHILHTHTAKAGTIGRLAALLAGDVDAIENIPTADTARIKANANFRLEQKVSWRTIFFHLDQYRDHPPGVTDKNGKTLAKNPFRDVRVREALALAINRQAIVERAMEGFAVAAGNIVAPPVFGHNATVKPAAYDPDAAKKLLAAAGYPDGFSIVLAAPNNRYVNDDQVAQVVAQMLARAGITVSRVEPHPAASYFTKARNGDFAFAMLGWGSFGADLALRTLVATSNAEKGYGTWNWGRYSNPRVDQLVEQALASVDPARREAAAREAMGIAMKDYALIPVHHQIASWAMKKGLAYTPRTDEFTFAQHFRPQ